MQCPACGHVMRGDSVGVRVYSCALDVALARDTPSGDRTGALAVMRAISSHWGMDSGRGRRERPLFGDLIREALRHRMEGAS